LPPTRWPVSAHTSVSWLDTQRNFSERCIGPLASELLGHQRKQAPTKQKGVVRWQSKKPIRPKFAPCGSWWPWLFLSSPPGLVGTCGLILIGFTGTDSGSLPESDAVGGRVNEDRQSGGSRIAQESRAGLLDVPSWRPAVAAQIWSRGHARLHGPAGSRPERWL